MMQGRKYTQTSELDDVKIMTDVMKTMKWAVTLESD